MNSNVKQAKYEVVESKDDIQIRDYAPMIVAEAEVSGERKEAINQGFHLSAFIKEKKLNALSQAAFGFFNPPWTLPFLRRNEVMVEVAT